MYCRKEENKKKFVEVNPFSSVTSLAQELNIGRETCRKILLDKEGYKSYKFKSVQKLHDGDEFRQMEFCEKMMDKINVNPRVKSKIIFTDECAFFVEGFINNKTTECGPRKTQMPRGTVIVRYVKK